jgi:uncharacterized RDD family membrane protein YckC
MTASVAAAGPRAGFVTRLAALIVDALVVVFGLRGTMWLLDVNAHFLRRFAPPVSLSAVVLVCAPFVAGLYQVIGWRLRGQTVGKWLLGIRVVSLGGGTVGVARAVIRFGGYFLSGLPFYLGFLWVLGPERRAFHDLLAGTEVVQARPPARGWPALHGGSLPTKQLSAT